MKKLFYIILMVVVAALLAAGLTACDEREFENPQYWASRQTDTAGNDESLPGQTGNTAGNEPEASENRGTGQALPNRPETDTSDATPSNPPESEPPQPTADPSEPPADDVPADDAPPPATPPAAETPAETPAAPPAPLPAESEPEPETGIPESDFPPEMTSEEPEEPETAGAEISHEFATDELGTLVKTDDQTTATAAEKPAWSRQSVAAASFERFGGKRYEVLVYERTEGETFSRWMAKSESGDAYLSAQTVRTKNGKTGYVYSTNDYGATPDVHIVVPTDRFVYRFSSEETRKEVPEDFLRFIRELEVE